MAENVASVGMAAPTGSEVIPAHGDSWTETPNVFPTLVVTLLGGTMYGVAIGIVPLLLQFNSYLGECSRYTAPNACDALTFTGCTWVSNAASVDNMASTNSSGSLSRAAAAVAPFCAYPDYAAVNCSSFATQSGCAGAFSGLSGTTCAWRYHAGFCEHFIGWSASQQGLLAGMQIVGSMIAAATGGWLLDKFGRRRSFAWIGFVTLLSCVCMTAGWANSENLPLLVVAELLVGLGAGWACVVCPVYCEEMLKDHPKLSQTLGVVFQVAVTIGIFLEAALGYALDPRADTATSDAHLQSRMNYIFLPQWISAALAIPVAYMVPESPVWLKERRGKPTEGCLVFFFSSSSSPTTSSSINGNNVGGIGSRNDNSLATSGGDESKRLMDDDDHHRDDEKHKAPTNRGGLDDIRRSLSGGKTPSDLAAEKARSEVVAVSSMTRYGSGDVDGINDSPAASAAAAAAAVVVERKESSTATNLVVPSAASATQEGGRADGSFTDLFQMKYAVPLSIAVAISAGQQLTGVNVVFVYGPTLASRLGVAPLAANFWISFWNFVTCVTAIPVASKYPPRVVFIMMCGLSAIATLLTGIAVTPGIFPEESLEHKVLGGVGISLYVWVFEVGLGSQFYPLAVQLFENVPNIGNHGTSFCVWSNFVFNAFINWCYPIIAEALSGGPSGNQNRGTAISFFFFSAIGLLVFLFLLWKFPKTNAERARELAHKPLVTDINDS